MRCDTKRAIWWDLYNKHISIFCIKHTSTIFHTLQVNKWQLKNQTFLSFCEINATKFGSKYQILHTIIYHYMTSCGYIIMNIVDSCMIWFHFHLSCSWRNHIILLLMFVAEKVLLFLVISLTADDISNCVGQLDADNGHAIYLNEDPVHCGNFTSSARDPLRNMWCIALNKKR